MGLPPAMLVTGGLRQFPIGIVLLMGTGVVGCAIPALRAIRVEPLGALRFE